MYDKLILQIHMYTEVMRILSKGYLHMFSYITIKITRNFKCS